MGSIAIRDPSKHGTKLIYDQLPRAGSTEIPYPQERVSAGNVDDPPQWVIPKGWTVSVIPGKSETRIVLRVPDHTYHRSEYATLVRQFQEVHNNPMPSFDDLDLESPATSTTGILTSAQQYTRANQKVRYAWIVGNRRLGSGESSQVFEVFHSSNWTKCAGKRMYKYRQFHHEYSLMRTINHGHIARYIDIQDVLGSDPMIIMECFHLGSLLKQYRESRFDEAEIIEITTQALSAIDYLHSYNITHRDLKPANILVRSRQPLEIAVSDFGWSVQDVSDMATVAGTKYYMAPEVLDIHHTETERGHMTRYTNKSDIWSLGVVAVELVFGRLPQFGGRRGFDLDYCQAISESVPELLGSLRSKDFLYLVQDMLAWDHYDRPSAEDCLVRLPRSALDNRSESSHGSASDSEGVYSMSSVRRGKQPAFGSSSGSMTQRAMMPADLPEMVVDSAAIGPGSGGATQLDRDLNEHSPYGSQSDDSEGEESVQGSEPVWEGEVEGRAWTPSPSSATGMERASDYPPLM